MPFHGKLRSMLNCNVVNNILLAYRREIMQEWVETLRAKLREMKILSPRENLYTKLPEVRAPLLPTRDPTSPLPAPPPVPAAIVPGVERIPAHQHQSAAANEQISRAAPTVAPAPVIEAVATTTTAALVPPPPPPPTTAMSNTLTQHLLNMLSDPISTYSEQINDTATTAVAEEQEDAQQPHAIASELPRETAADLHVSDEEFLTPILRNGVRVDVAAASTQRISAGKCPCSIIAQHHQFNNICNKLFVTDQILNFDQMIQCERLIPR